MGENESEAERSRMEGELMVGSAHKVDANNLEVFKRFHALYRYSNAIFSASYCG